MTSSMEPLRLLDTEQGLSNPLREALKAGRAIHPTKAQITDLSQRLASMLPVEPSSLRPLDGSAGQTVNTAGSHFTLGKGILAVVTFAVATPLAINAWIKSSQEVPSRRNPLVEKPSSLSEPPPLNRVEHSVPLTDEQAENRSKREIPIALTRGIAPRPAPLKAVYGGQASSLQNRYTKPNQPKKAPAEIAEVSNAFSMADELGLIRQARDDLSLAPRKALRLMAQHAKQFPNGMFVQEREIVAVEALVNIGDIETARKRASDLIRSFPNTAYKHRIEILIK
jgi:hypothetical protein